MNSQEHFAKLALLTLPTVAVLAFFQAGCSETGYPAVHDMPAPRAETPLTPDQVKEATDALISERDRLSTEVQGSGQPNAAASAVSAQQKPSSSSRPTVAPASDAAQAAGADAKP